MGHIVRYSGESKTLLWLSGDYVYAQITLPVNARILEVGGGQDPHPASDVIVDKYLDDNRHRMGGVGFMSEGRLVAALPDGTVRVAGAFQPKIIQADVCSMPFEDKEFDFCIAKDILEHVLDIEQACREISRVAKAGFIDCPRLTSEYLWPQGDIHLWVFENGPRGLIAHRKQFDSPFGKTLHDAFAASDEMKAAWSKSRHYFHLAGFWQDALGVEIGAPETAQWLRGTWDIGGVG